VVEGAVCGDADSLGELLWAGLVARIALVHTQEASKVEGDLERQHAQARHAKPLSPASSSARFSAARLRVRDGGTLLSCHWTQLFTAHLIHLLSIMAHLTSDPPPRLQFAYLTTSHYGQTSYFNHPETHRCREGSVYTRASTRSTRPARARSR
jgi:hypothetical protein